MVFSCVIANCTSQGKNLKKCNEKRSVKRSEDISFHLLPGDPQMLAQWVAAISKYHPDYKPERGHRVCSKHFKPSDFYANGFKRILGKKSIPSIFDHIPEHVRNEEDPSSRKTMRTERPLNLQALPVDDPPISVTDTVSTSLSTPSPRTRRSLIHNKSSVGHSSLAAAIASTRTLKVSPPRTRGRKSLVPHHISMDHPSLPKATASSTSSATNESSLFLHPNPADCPSPIKAATSSTSLTTKTTTKSSLIPHPISVDHPSLPKSTASATLSGATENSPICQPLSVDFSALRATLSASTLSAPLSPRTKSYLLCNSLPIPRVSRRKALNSYADHNYHTASLNDKHKETLMQKIHLLRANNKTLRQKVRRYTKAKAKLQGIIDELQSSSVVDKKAFEMLQSAFSGLSLHLFLHLYTHKDTASSSAIHYKQEIKDFACTLHHISPLAYRYLKDIFKLPAENTLRIWRWKNRERDNRPAGQEEQDEVVQSENMVVLSSEELEEANTQLDMRKENDFFGTYSSMLRTGIATEDQDQVEDMQNEPVR